MKAAHDAGTDKLSIIPKADAVVAESDEDKPGVILDYDAAGNRCGARQLRRRRTALASPELSAAARTTLGIETAPSLANLRHVHRANLADHRARHRFFVTGPE